MVASSPKLPITNYPDMVDYGLSYEGRRLAIQYGDGAAILAFWKDDLYWYTISAKVRMMTG